MYVLSYQPIIRQSMFGVLCALSLLTARAVQADDVDAVFNTNPVFVPDNGNNPGPLVTLIQTVINTPGPRELVIHYFAECAVSGAAAGSTRFIDYTILVNGVPVPPTNVIDSALCQATVDDESVGTVVVKPVSEGNHTILVQGQMRGPAPGQGVVDEQSLVIEEEGP